MNNLLNYSMTRQRYNKIPKWRFILKARCNKKLDVIKLDINNQDFDTLTSDFFAFINSLNGDSDNIKEYMTDDIEFTKYYMKISINDENNTCVTYIPTKQNYMVESDNIAFTVDNKTKINHASQELWDSIKKLSRKAYIANIESIVDEYLF